MNQKEKRQSTEIEIDKAKICLETAQISWRELQRFFASGKVYQVAAELDLTEVALHLSTDDIVYVQNLVDAQKLMLVPDEVAMHWWESDARLWSVVVKPFVLVQEK